MKAWKFAGSSLLVLILVLALLLYIDPQLKGAHREQPYLKLVEEQQGPPPKESEIIQRIILVGDAGLATMKPWQASMARIAERASISPETTAIVGLGDNIYDRGYPQKEVGQQGWDEDQLESISFLDAQLIVAKESGAKMFFVPGNHDWFATEVDSQAAHIAAYAKLHNVYTRFEPYEIDQDPLPESESLNGATLIFLDSEWTLQADEQNRKRVLDTLNTELARISSERPNDIVVINAHHPLETWGPHGGHFANFSRWLIMNILYMVTDEAAAQDTSGYSKLIQQINAVLSQYDNVIFAAGHDHNLQVMHEPASGGPDYNIVSGAGNLNKITGVWHGENTRFALSREGFIELNVTANGTYLQVFDIEREGAIEGFWLALGAAKLKR